MHENKKISALGIVGSLCMVASLLGSAGCEQPLNIIVSTTNLPADSDGLEFLVRTVTAPMGGQDAVQVAAATPVQRIRFADTTSPTGSTYTFGLYLSSEPSSGKIQVNVAALKNGCPIATGVAEINPPLSLQNLPVDLRPTLGRGTADFVNGCPQGRPQIFAIVRTTTQINGSPASLQVGLTGWGYYPQSRVQIAFEPSPGVADPRFILPSPPAFSNHASDIHTTYQPEDLPITISEFEGGFTGEASVKVSVSNPDGQSTSILLTELN